MRTNFQEENLKKGDEKTCNHYSNSGPTKHKRKRNTWPYGAYGATVLGTKSSSSSFFSAQTKALILLIRQKEPRFFLPLLRLPFAIIVIVCLSFVVVEGKNTNLARILLLYLSPRLSFSISLSILSEGRLIGYSRRNVTAVGFVGNRRYEQRGIKVSQE